MEWLIFTIIGILVARHSDRLFQCHKFGIYCDLILGVTGALLGGVLFYLFKASYEVNLIGSFFTSALGAVFLIWYANYQKKRSEEAKRIKKILDIYFIDDAKHLQT